MELRAFVASRREKQYQIEYVPNQNRWNEYFVGTDNPICLESNWSEEIKYLDNGQLSDSIKSLPRNKGGIYMFYLKGINLPFVEHYILYIGRARYTGNENINSRARDYIHDDRELIKLMFDLWADQLYYRYYPDTDNETINRNEVLLIRSIVPPFNTIIPNNIQEQPEINAF